jgi:hypothetical protein
MNGRHKCYSDPRSWPKGKRAFRVGAIVVTLCRCGAVRLEGCAAVDHLDVARGSSAASAIAMSAEPKPPPVPCSFHLGAPHEACWRCGATLAAALPHGRG